MDIKPSLVVSKGFMIRVFELHFSVVAIAVLCNFHVDMDAILDHLLY